VSAVNRINANLLRRLAPLKRAAAWVSVALVLMLSVLAVSPATHEHLHCDAGQAEHTCAITLFAQGVTTAAVAMVLAVVVWRLLNRVAVWWDVFVLAPAFSHLPGRAPPVA
jgi:type III secretory pathway component EscT